MADAQVYYGTKRIEAWPQDKNLGPSLRADLGGGVYMESADIRIAPGYAIRYPDGYESWSPKDVFEAAYRPSSCMGFEGALAAMREGRRVRRIGIDAEGVSIWLNNGTFYCQREGTYAGVWWPNPDSLLADWMVVE